MHQYHAYASCHMRQERQFTRQLTGGYVCDTVRHASDSAAVGTEVGW